MLTKPQTKTTIEFELLNPFPVDGINTKEGDFFTFDSPFYVYQPVAIVETSPPTIDEALEWLTAQLEFLTVPEPQPVRRGYHVLCDA